MTTELSDTAGPPATEAILLPEADTSLATFVKALRSSFDKDPDEKEDARPMPLITRAVHAHAREVYKNNVYKAHISNQDNALKKAHDRIDTVENELSSANDRLGTVENELSSANDRLGTVENELSSANDRLGTVESELLSANAALDTQRTEIAACTAQRDELSARHRTLEHQYSVQAADLTMARSQLDMACKDARDAKLQVHFLTEKMDEICLERDNACLETAGLGVRHLELQETLEALKGVKEELVRRLEVLAEEQDTHTLRFSELQEAHERLAHTLSDANGQLAAAQSELHDAQAKISTLEAKVQELGTNLFAKEVEVAMLYKQEGEAEEALALERAKVIDLDVQVSATRLMVEMLMKQGEEAIEERDTEHDARIAAEEALDLERAKVTDLDEELATKQLAVEVLTKQGNQALQDLDAEKAANASVENNLAVERRKVTELERHLRKVSGRLTATRSKIKALGWDLLAERTNVVLLTQQEEEALQELATEEAARAAAENDLKLSQGMVAALEEAVQKSAEALRAKEAQFDALVQQHKDALEVERTARLAAEEKNDILDGELHQQRALAAHSRQRSEKLGRLVATTSEAKEKAETQLTELNTAYTYISQHLYQAKEVLASTKEELAAEKQAVEAERAARIAAENEKDEMAAKMAALLAEVEAMKRAKNEMETIERENAELADRNLALAMQLDRECEAHAAAREHLDGMQGRLVVITSNSRRMEEELAELRAEKEVTMQMLKRQGARGGVVADTPKKTLLHTRNSGWNSPGPDIPALPVPPATVKVKEDIAMAKENVPVAHSSVDLNPGTVRGPVLDSRRSSSAFYSGTGFRRLMGFSATGSGSGSTSEDGAASPALS